MYHKRGARVAVKKPNSRELTDLLTEGISAVIETQDSYRHDWYRFVHNKPSTGGFSETDAAIIRGCVQ